MLLFSRFKAKSQPYVPEEELRKYCCAFTGHRPEKLYGQEAYVIVELRKAIEAAVVEGYPTFVTGCSR